MVDFIKKLKSGMYMREMMNVVLEHLGVIQVNDFKLNFINIGYFFFLFQTIVSKDTDELLLCIAYIFEISESSSLGGTQSAAYRLCD